MVGLHPASFPAHTRIQTSRNAASALRVGDVVLASCARVDRGRGAIVRSRVTWAYRDAATNLIHLRWFDGTAQVVITNPGQHSLDALGGFRTIEELTRTGYRT